ncbi:MAG: hypothetical protein ABIC19_03300 [Patescibacteria group bacterium]
MSAAAQEKKIKIKVVKKSADKPGEAPKKAAKTAKPALLNKNLERAGQAQNFQKNKTTVFIGVAIIMLIIVIIWFSLLGNILSGEKISNSGFWGRLMTNMKDNIDGIKNSIEGIKDTFKTNPLDTNTNESELEKNVFPEVK